MTKFLVHLSSGAALTVIADDFIVTYDAGGPFKWKAEGLKQGIRKPLFIDPKAIVAVESSP